MTYYNPFDFKFQMTFSIDLHNFLCFRQWKHQTVQQISSLSAISSRLCFFIMPAAYLSALLLTYLQLIFCFSTLFILSSSSSSRRWQILQFVCLGLGWLALASAALWQLFSQTCPPPEHLLRAHPSLLFSYPLACALVASLTLSRWEFSTFSLLHHLSCEMRQTHSGQSDQPQDQRTTYAPLPPPLFYATPAMADRQLHWMACGCRVVLVVSWSCS